MDDTLFQIAQTAIDAAIDGWVGRPAGITVGFTLAFEFSRRGLPEDIDYVVFGEVWQSRRYRDRLIQPDPELDEYDFVFGLRLL